MTEGRTVGLAEALAGLVEVGVAHGVDEASVRAEGEALAATVAEAAPGAHVDWVRITGGDRGAEDFMAAASRGRRWRSGPTPVLSDLVAGRSPGAAAYAKGLGDVRGVGSPRSAAPPPPLRPRVPSPWARAARTHGK